MSGAAPRRPALAEGQVTLGGRTFTLRYAIMALNRLEEHFEAADVNEAVAKFAALSGGGDGPARFRTKDIVGILWAGMAAHHPEVSRDEVWRLLDQDSLAHMSQVAGEFTAAFAASLPAPEAQAEGAAAREGPS